MQKVIGISEMVAISAEGTLFADKFYSHINFHYCLTTLFIGWVIILAIMTYILLFHSVAFAMTYSW